MHVSNMIIHEPEGPFLVINADDGEELVRIDRDLTLTFGESYVPDEAAWRFWDAFRRHAHDPVARE